MINSTIPHEPNKWYHVAVTSSGTAWKLYLDGEPQSLGVTYGANTGDWFADIADRDRISIGCLARSTNVSFLNGLINSVKVFSKTLSDAEVLTDYQRGARLLRYRNTFLDAPVTLAASSRELSDFQISTGIWKISEDASNQKWLECVTVGVAYIPSTQVFGTWQFDIMKKNEGSSPMVHFINFLPNAAGNGYEFSVSSSERLYIGRVTSGGSTPLLYSAIAYIFVNIRYTIRITRTHTGVFTLYIRGGAYTDWTVVSTTSGLGTNPTAADTTYTSSKYLAHAAVGAASDKISNIVMVEGVLDPTTFPEII